MIERNVFEEQACMVKMNSGGLYTSATALLAKTPHRRAENMGGGVMFCFFQTLLVIWLSSEVAPFLLSF